MANRRRRGVGPSGPRGGSHPVVGRPPTLARTVYGGWGHRPFRRQPTPMPGFPGSSPRSPAGTGARPSCCGRRSASTAGGGWLIARTCGRRPGSCTASFGGGGWSRLSVPSHRLAQPRVVPPTCRHPPVTCQFQIQHLYRSRPVSEGGLGTKLHARSEALTCGYLRRDQGLWMPPRPLVAS